jgi:mono/diheme cytochrome c family protein
MNISTAKHLHTLLLAALFSVAAFALAAEPTLELGIGQPLQNLSRNELLANAAVRTIDVPADAAYRRSMHYRALPLTALIGHLAQTGSVQFTASDGFVANIPGPLLAGAGQAWLAIEPADAGWPALKPGGASAGPFYLVWLTPEKAGISPEQWPYQIAKIAAAAPLESRYPQILPHSSAATDNREQRGLHVYTANCATCHQINGAGDAAIGPDLNLPLSPTEYFQETYLRKLIRNPAAVRNWGQRRMPGFSPEVLSDASLDDLIAYLRQMAKQRAKQRQ